VTTLDNQLFVMYQSAHQQIQVYDATSFTLLRHIAVPGLENTVGDIVACPVNRCLYASKCNKSMVHRIDMRDSITRWNVYGGPTGLSVNQVNNLLITCSNIIVEHTTQGSLVRTVNIDPSLDIANAFQVIQVTNDQWAVSHAATITVVNEAGALVSRYAGPMPLNATAGLVAVNSDYIVVAGQKTNTIVVITSDLSSARQMSLPAGTLLRGPRVLSIDRSSDRLYVGVNSGRVLVFDNVSKIGDDFQLCCI
jgi:hypothetical protein